MSSKVICIAGMHRTGSSLFSSWLLSCGLDIGSDTIGPSYGNLYGHFEDKEFVEFHKKILNSRGLSHLLIEPLNLTFNTEETEAAKKIVERKNRKNIQWAWKDPRSSIFLREWDKIIEDLKVIILVRSPQLVIDSMIRREFQFYQNRSGWKWAVLYVWSLWKQLTGLKQKRRRYCQTYLAYYQHILDYLKTKDIGKDCIVLDIDQVLEKDKDIVKHIEYTWGFHMKYQPFKHVYDKKIFKRSNKSNFKLAKKWEKDLNQLYAVLMSYCLSTKQLLDE